MRSSKFLIAATAALLLSGGVCQAEDAAPAPGRHSMMMMGDDGQGAMGKRCMHKGMQGRGRMPHMMPLPSLPPGNAKLELQMQAEIMQKVGEILAKYAEQVKEPAAQ